MSTKHFPMKIDAAWRIPMALIGATPSSSYAEVTDDNVRFRCGLAFDRTIPRDEIAGVDQRGWPWWMGIGLRTNLRGLIGLIGSTDGVVEVLLRTRSRAWGVFPCNRIAISVQDPEGLVAAIESEPEAAARPARATTSHTRKPTTRARRPRKS